MEKLLNLNVKDLLYVMRYDKKDGNFYWTKKISRVTSIGDMCGSLVKGYIYIRYNGFGAYAHRLAWFLEYGSIPEFLDHINGVRNDNRLENLRPCTRVENCQNRKNASINNKITGLLGVSLNKSTNKYVAAIRVPGKRIHLGTFNTPELAHQAYMEAKEKFHIRTN